MDTTGQHIAVSQLVCIIPIAIGVDCRARLIAQSTRMSRGILWVNAYHQR
jgi:hypothetical protein